MKSALTRGIKQLLEEAEANVQGIEPSEAVTLIDDAGWLIVDVRDVRERARDGFIPGSFHCPRGMVEFWIDPDSPYYKPQFAKGQKLLFHCAAEWRSILTAHTVRQMGIDGAFYMKGGLKGWKEVHGPVAFDTAEP
jgi:rhodanese-related sulfurtransferase